MRMTRERTGMLRIMVDLDLGVVYSKRGVGGRKHVTSRVRMLVGTGAHAPFPPDPPLGRVPEAGERIPDSATIRGFHTSQ